MWSLYTVYHFWIRSFSGLKERERESRAQSAADAQPRCVKEGASALSLARAVCPPARLARSIPSFLPRPRLRREQLLQIAYCIVRVALDANLLAKVLRDEIGLLVNSLVVLLKTFFGALENKFQWQIITDGFSPELNAGREISHSFDQFPESPK